ncbi:cytochrome C oxidase subunit IV family protein [Pseudonocardia sp. Cha107L01]|uniref:cytochrome C oxidase subunit IV family protein n=1 Tax=Pseudonocardia sp. Cha107L01 TaxID=3457576 RepID=UPI00403E3DE8
MVALLRRPVSVVWIVLMVLTCISTWCLSKDAFSPLVATVGIFLIAAFKVCLVVLHFMELRHAPIPVRLAFEAWIVVATGVILGFYVAT